MDKFQTYYADVRDPAQQPHIAARLRDQGLPPSEQQAATAARSASRRGPGGQASGSGSTI